MLAVGIGPIGPIEGLIILAVVILIFGVGKVSDIGGAPGIEFPWEGCKVEHDRTYHDAGDTTTPAESSDARLVADRELRTCVARSNRVLAFAMYYAVRVGGIPSTGLSWQWGYGLPKCGKLG